MAVELDFLGPNRVIWQEILANSLLSQLDVLRIILQLMCKNLRWVKVALHALTLLLFCIL